MNTTALVVEIRPEKKFRPARDLNPWPLRHRCSALSTELMSQLGAGPNQPSKWWIMTYLFFIYFILTVIKLSYALFLAVVEKLLYNKVLVSDVFLCTDQAPVVRRSDNAIHWINLYPVDNALRFAILSPGYRLISWRALSTLYTTRPWC